MTTAILVCLGRDRDKEIGQEGTSAETGTAAWAPIWLEAERLIREELWPAVQAVAEGLENSLGTDHDGWLSGQEVAELASAAMGGGRSAGTSE